MFARVPLLFNLEVNPKIALSGLCASEAFQINRISVLQRYIITT
ncbi:unknown protein [Cronobacter turicensis z3032]|uniref:Uncharacterized protein n=1 Tax=Cronobacter turicensis (strain DSM 18703 / CCUG 55852 / LMG 23827 / z3032) TaxID=693216 RepID=C9Y1H7_CROTZ|nr:unknown protein [Cronobacter turicensis z3032]